jgi:hypothetical protein
MCLFQPPADIVPNAKRTLFSVSCADPYQIAPAKLQHFQRRCADKIKVSLKIWTGCFPAGGFDQNCYSSVKHLAAQVHPGELPRKPSGGSQPGSTPV